MNGILLQFFFNCGILLRNKGVWTAKLPYKSSWAVRKILNARNFARPFIGYCVGQQSDFLLWHDPWVNNRPLLEQYSSSIISNAESSGLARVSSMQCNGAWDLPSSNHVDVMDLRIKVASTHIHCTDFITWDGRRRKSVSLSSIWSSFRESSPLVPWFDIVWNSFSIPKCSFIFWLAIRNRLLTRDRMLSFGMQVDSSCVLCGGGPESIYHILSTCPYFDLIRGACPVQIVTDWRLCQAGNFFMSDVSRPRRLIGSLFMASAIYCTWKERNYRIHNPGPGHSTVSIMCNVKRMVKEKLASCNMFKKWAVKDPSLILLLY